MSEKYAIDKCINDFEFRNFVSWFLEKKEYHFFSMDDSRWDDENRKNNNDIIVVKDGTKYTVQTFLNKPITYYRISETKKDIEKEDVLDGIIFTNKNISEEAKKDALKNHIIIFDKDDLEEEFDSFKDLSE